MAEQEVAVRAQMETMLMETNKNVLQLMMTAEEPVAQVVQGAATVVAMQEMEEVPIQEEPVLVPADVVVMQLAALQEEQELREEQQA